MHKGDHAPHPLSLDECLCHYIPCSDSSCVARYDRAVETRHVSVDAGNSSRRGGGRWQEGRVLGGGAGIASLQALLQPHVESSDFGLEDRKQGKENAQPRSGRRSDMGENDPNEVMQMKSGVRGLQQMRRHGDKIRDFTDDQYSASVSARLKASPFC